MKISELVPPISEALKLSQARSYVKGWNKARYQTIFRKYASDEKAYRIYLPLLAMPSTVKITPNEYIENAVKKRGYVVDDYIQGIAVSPDGKKRIKIGKLLSDAPRLQQLFINDPSRTAGKKSNLLVVISRHPYDIAGMSTGRGWRSCMSLEDGSNRHYVMHDVLAGTLVAYLIENNDKNINSPIGRLLIKPFINVADENDVLLIREDTVYGTDKSGFKETVDKWLDKVNPSVSGLFCKDTSLYDDNDIAELFKGTPDEERLFNLFSNSDTNDITADDITALNKSSDALKMAIINRADNVKYIEDQTTQFQFFVVKKYPLSVKYLKNPIEEVQLLAVSKNGYVIEYIKNPSEAVQIAAVTRYGYAIRYIENPSEAVQLAAVNTYGSAIQFIKNPSETVQMAAVKQNGHAIQFIDNPSEAVQIAAVTLYPELVGLINNPMPYIVGKSLTINPSNIKLITNPSEALQMIAVKKDIRTYYYIPYPAADSVTKYVRDVLLNMSESERISFITKDQNSSCYG